MIHAEIKRLFTKKMIVVLCAMMVAFISLDFLNNSQLNSDDFSNKYQLFETMKDDYQQALTSDDRLELFYRFNALYEDLPKEHTLEYILLFLSDNQTKYQEVLKTRGFDIFNNEAIFELESKLSLPIYSDNNRIKLNETLKQKKELATLMIEPSQISNIQLETVQLKFFLIIGFALYIQYELWMSEKINHMDILLTTSRMGIKKSIPVKIYTVLIYLSTVAILSFLSSTVSIFIRGGNLFSPIQGILYFTNVSKSITVIEYLVWTHFYIIIISCVVVSVVKTLYLVKKTVGEFILMIISILVIQYFVVFFVSDFGPIYFLNFITFPSLFDLKKIFDFNSSVVIAGSYFSKLQFIQLFLIVIFLITLIIDRSSKSGIFDFKHNFFLQKFLKEVTS